MANNQSRSGKRRRWMWMGSAALLATGALGLTAALRPNHVIDPSKLATVERGNIVKSVVATGTIEPLTKVEIKSKASGIVKRLLVDYGDRVKAGQVLVELDKEQLLDRVHEAEANLAAARASVESADATYQRNLVDAEGPDVPFLKATADRDRKLAADGLVSASAVDDAERAYQLALNKQMSAQRSVAVSKADVARAKAQVAQAEAGLGRRGARGVVLGDHDVQVAEAQIGHGGRAVAFGDDGLDSGARGGEVAQGGADQRAHDALEGCDPYRAGRLAG